MTEKKTEKKMSDGDKIDMLIALAEANGWSLPKGLRDDKDED